MFRAMLVVLVFLLLAVPLAGCGSDPTPSASGAGADPIVSAAGFPVPDTAAIPAGPEGASIRRGRALLSHTRDSLPHLVGNDLRCVSCHLDDGTRPYAAPWVGVYSRFPQYRSRNGKINVIQDRINDCIQRSLNGMPLPVDGPDMADIIAYMAFLSRGVAPPGKVEGEGFRRGEPLAPDTARGRLVYVAECARCHGGNGEGMDNPDAAGDPRYYPPLWGPRSYTVGAGMARLRTAAAFVAVNMPFDRPGTLAEQDAWDVAAFVVAQPRPDFVGKERDWPNGDPPPDVAYRTRAAPTVGAQNPLLPGRTDR